MQSLKILGINGSSPFDTKGKNRPHGGSVMKLLNKVIGAAETEIELLGNSSETEIVHLHEEIKGFYQGNYDFLPDYIVPLFRKMLTADILVFASPVQWYAMSDYMKSLINHLTALEGSAEDIGEKFPDLTLKSSERQLAGKVGAVVATCHHDGCAQAIASIATPLNDMGLIMVPGGTSYYNNKNWSVEESDEDGDWQNEDYARVGQNLARLAIILKSSTLDVNNWEARKAE